MSSYRGAFSNFKTMEAAPGFEPGDEGFANLCLTTWLCRPSHFGLTLRIPHYGLLLNHIDFERDVKEQFLE